MSGNNGNGNGNGHVAKLAGKTNGHSNGHSSGWVTGHHLTPHQIDHIFAGYTAALKAQEMERAAAVEKLARERAEAIAQGLKFEVLEEVKPRTILRHF
jgi:hypothetical protein